MIKLLAAVKVMYTTIKQFCLLTYLHFYFFKSLINNYENF